MVDAVIPAASAQPRDRARGRQAVAVLAAAMLLLGGAWLWAEWGPLLAFDSLVSFCF